MHPVVKGMVQVAGTTYRIVRTEPHHYDVIRIADDVRLGSFRSRPPFEVTAIAAELAAVREIARAAMKSAKTSWVGRLSLG